MRKPSEFACRAGESWRDVVARLGNEQGLAYECLEEFDSLIEHNPEQQDRAAMVALLEWDCFPLEAQ